MCDGWSCGTELKMWNGQLGQKHPDGSRWSDGSNWMEADGQTEVNGDRWSKCATDNREPCTYIE